MRKLLLFPSTLFIIVTNAQTNDALSFNGTNNYVTIGTPLSTNTSYTKEAWVYLTTSAGARNIISSLNAPFWINGGILSAGQAGSFSLVTDASSFPLNTWVYVAVTYDQATTTMKLYRDGILLSTNNAVSSYTSENTFIGSHQGSASFFQGNIDEVRIWNTALTQTQLKQNMYKGPADNATGLLAHYKFNDGSGSTLTNSCTNTTGLDGTLQNSPSWVASPVQFSANALNFDGANDIVVIPQVVSSDFTVEYWMNTSSTGPGGSQWYNGDGIVDAEVAGVTNDWGTALIGSKLGFGIGNPDITLISSTSVNTGSWIHVAATWKQSTGAMVLYINGNQEGSTTGGTNLRSAPARITFGELQTNIQRYNGSIDEVRIWNIVRTPAQIQANMNKELDPVAETNLVAYYSFDQGIAAGTNTGLTTLTDQKNTNNGTLSNFSLSGLSSNFVSQNNNLIVLPLKWLSFTAQKQNENVLLSWSTADEQNTKDFIVQHSVNIRDWNNIAIVTAAGNINTTNNYSYLHSTPAEGVNYYRILQRNIDGRYNYSETRSVNFVGKKLSFSILVNPVTDGVLKIQVNRNSNLSLYNYNGALLWKKRSPPGTELINMQVYASGTYFLKSNDQTETIIVQ